MTTRKQSSLTLAVCAHRAEHCIGPCLESIEAQTVPPDDVVVCVHEFDDPTVQVARAHGARVIASHGAGLFQSRNAVLDDCDTEYLAFTDADCVLVEDWVARVKQVLGNHPEVGAGTGRHPPIGPHTFAAWIHHMWFLVETRETGETDGVIGGNSYFRTDALRKVGGWPDLPGYSNAEDVYISIKLRDAGYRIWFEQDIRAMHSYESRFWELMRKSVRMGEGIVVMLRAAKLYRGLWWYTLIIPVLPVMVSAGVATLFVSVPFGAALIMLPLMGTLTYLTLSFRNPAKALPRWAARWIVIWPYSLGILKGLFATIPSSAQPGMNRNGL